MFTRCALIVGMVVSLSGCGPVLYHSDPSRSFEQDRAECEWEAKSRYGNQFSYGDPYGAMSAWTITENINLCLRAKGWHERAKGEVVLPKVENERKGDSIHSVVNKASKNKKAK